MSSAPPSPGSSPSTTPDASCTDSTPR